MPSSDVLEVKNAGIEFPTLMRLSQSRQALLIIAALCWFPPTFHVEDGTSEALQLLGDL